MITIMKMNNLMVKQPSHGIVFEILCYVLKNVVRKCQLSICVVCFHLLLVLGIYY